MSPDPDDTHCAMPALALAASITLGLIATAGWTARGWGR